MVKVTGKLTEEQIAALGDPRVVIEDLKRFRRSIDAFNGQCRELLERFPDQWVAFYDGEFRAHAESLDAILEEVDRLNIPRGEAFLELLETDPAVLIL